MTKISVEHLLDLIDSLPKKSYDYIIPCSNKAVLLKVDKSSQIVEVDKLSDSGTRKSAGITKESLSIIADAAIKGKPFSVDSIFNASGSARSTWEALIANTTEFYWCKFNKKKHLVWLPDNPHDLGVVKQITPSDLPDVKINNLEPSVSGYITRFDYESLNQDNLVELLKEIVKQVSDDELTFALHDFAIRYATHIDDCSQLANKIWGSDSNSAVLSEGQKIGLYYRSLISKSVDKSAKLQVLNFPLQQIYYGAPGTGKSHATNEVTSCYPDTVRTTFHPDSDYSTFVGAYKPTMEEVEVKTVPVVVAGGITLEQNKGTYKEKKIAYKFVKQAFLKAYVKAWKLFKETCVDEGKLAPQFLVIEEINRGNCAQIFGDLFQLLDRKQNFSEYPIEADDDIRKALLEEDTKENPSFGENGLQLTPEQVSYVNQVFDTDGEPSRKIAEKICTGQVLVLPPNLYIWATMNTSDQSLFPIDSAFKRRWEWKYVRINEGKDKETGQSLNYRIQFSTLEGEKVDESWWDFIQKINEKIEVATKSEDKKLGYYFCKPDKKANDTDKENTIISAETFVGKVVFYLWQDVFKDYGFKSDIFKKEGNARLAFHDFYPHNIEPDEEKNPEGIDLKLVKRFIDKVMDRNPTETTAEAPVASANE